MKVSKIHLFFGACISILIMVQCEPLTKITKTAKCGVHQFGEILYTHDHHHDPCQNDNDGQVIPMPNGNRNHGEISNQNKGHQRNHNHGRNYNKDEGHQENHNHGVTSSENEGRHIKDTNNITKKKVPKPPSKTEQTSGRPVSTEGTESTKTIDIETKQVFKVGSNCPKGTKGDGNGNCREVID